VKRNNPQELFTTANIVSASRFLFLPFIVYFLATGYRVWALVFILISYLTDLVDGYLARRLNQISFYGKIIDPVTDKLNLAAILITLYFTDKFPLWCLLAVLLRDMLILTGSIFFIKKENAVFPSNTPGKVTGFVFGALVIIYVLRIDPLKIPLVYLTAVLLIISFVSYLKVYLANIKK